MAERTEFETHTHTSRAFHKWTEPLGSGSATVGDLRQFVGACAEMPDDTEVVIYKGELPPSSNYYRHWSLSATWERSAECYGAGPE